MCPRGEPDDLVGEPGDEREEQDPGGDHPQQRGVADERVDEDRHDHDRQQEVRAAADVLGRVLLRRLRGELGAALVRGDRLVLRAVVLEHALDVGQERDEDEVAEEDREADRALGEVGRDAAQPERAGEALVHERREDDEQRGEEDERAADRPAHRPWRDALLLGELTVRRPRERPEPERQRLGERRDAPGDRDAGTTARPSSARRAPSSSMSPSGVRTATA